MDMFKPTRRERFFLYNSLVCLAQSLQGKYTTVDLRNESCVTGRIDQVDGFMNIAMSDVVFMDTRGSEFAYDSFFVQARKIRYIHIPNEMAIVPTIEKKLAQVGFRRKTLPIQQNTKKGKRLAQRQEETLKLVQDYKQEKLLAVKKEKDQREDISQGTDITIQQSTRKGERLVQRQEETQNLVQDFKQDLLVVKKEEEEEESEDNSQGIQQNTRKGKRLAQRQEETQNLIQDFKQEELLVVKKEEEEEENEDNSHGISYS